jgi:segregation and condensation protein B
METKQLKNVIEAALLASGEPLSLDNLVALFGKDDEMPKDDIREVLKELQDDYEDRGIRLIEVASGYRIQVSDAMSPWLQKLWEGRPPRFSRALMETLAITAYRQPLTRGDIEDIRGVAVSTNIIRNLLDRGWLRPVGQRDVPGRPTLYATTKTFLDYFGLKRLEDLPPLADLQELDPVNVQLELSVPAEERVLAEGVSPGTMLVGVAGVNELPEEPASVTSLDERRKLKADAELDEVVETAEIAESEEVAAEDHAEADADVDAVDEVTEQAPLELDISAAEEQAVVEADEVAEEAPASVVPQKQS